MADQTVTDEPIQEVIFSDEDVRVIELEMRAQITNDGSYSDSLAHRMLALIATLRTVAESAVCYRCVERQQELTAALAEIERLRYGVAMTAIPEVIKERERQDRKWGKQNHSPSFWLAILTEEVGEAAQAVCKAGVPPFVLGESDEWLWHMRDELIHVAAVAIAAIESLDRNELSVGR